jgi:hypothetical protein
LLLRPSPDQRQTQNVSARHVCKTLLASLQESCKEAIIDRKKALRVFDLHPTSLNLDKFKINRATARRMIREEKRYSWQAYVSKLNYRTRLKRPGTWSGKSVVNHPV